MSLTGKRVLVTGAGGFIASHLSERLVAENCRVRALVHYRGDGSRGYLDCSPFARDMEIVGGDVRDSDHMRDICEGMDVVFHLAAIAPIPFSYVEPRLYAETNFVGTLNILQGVRHAGCGLLVHTSTSEVYGSCQYAPMDEKHPQVGQSPYSASKIAADKIAEAFHRSYGTPIVTVRPFNAIGPRQTARGVLPNIIAQLLCGRTVKLGNLSPTRDLNYVANTVDGFIAAAECEAAIGRTINIGSGREISVGGLALLIADLMGRPITIVTDQERVRPANSEVDRLVCDNRLARTLLGWAPRVSLEEGLMRTIEWMRENAGRYRAHEYAV